MKRQMRRKPRNGEGDQIERITPRESKSSGWGMEPRRSKESEEEGAWGRRERRGRSVCASRERGTVRWWDLFIVIPVLQLSSSLARPLINHSSTTHRLAKSPFLSRAPGPHIAAANLAVPPRGLSRERRWPTKRGRKEGEGRGSRTRLFMLWDSSNPPGVKVDEDRRGKSRKGTEI